jgi:hypothetical protein
MSAQTLIHLGNPDAAIKRLKSGIAAANRVHNAHAEAEMRVLLDDLSGLPKIV